MAHNYLPLIWFALLGFILLLYTMLDGFDLGVGVLTLLIRTEEERGILMGSLGTIWDANETWLVLFGGIIFGAFPEVYGLVMTGLYIPLVLMLVGLIFRAVSFEFRVHSSNKRRWSLAFAWGSILAAVGQGFAFGGLLWGIRSTGGTFTGGVMDWFNPFSAVITVAVLAGYSTFGSSYIVMKTTGAIHAFARRAGIYSTFVAVASVVAATILAASRYPSLREKWFAVPGFLFTSIPFLLAAIAFGFMIYGFLRGSDRLPFFSMLVFAFFGYLALSANYYPIIVPPNITIYDAAAQPNIQRIMLYAVGIALPFLLAYNILQYWIFRGKIESNVYEEE